MPLKSTKKPRRKATKATTNTSILIVGKTGTGKTRLIAEYVRRGFYTFMIHCGFGEPGTVTIREYIASTLKGTNQERDAKAQEHLDKYFRQFWLQNSEELIDIINSGWSAIEEILDDPEFVKNLKIIVFEEVNHGQNMFEMDIVPKEGGVPKPTLVSVAGEGEGKSYGHFRNLQMFSHHFVARMMRIGMPDHSYIKIIITAHESDKINRAKGAATGDEGPAFATTAANALVAACSYAFGLGMELGISKNSPPTYWVHFKKNNALYRIRAEGWPRKMKVDPKVLVDLIERKISPDQIPKELLG